PAAPGPRGARGRRPRRRVLRRPVGHREAGGVARALARAARPQLRRARRPGRRRAHAPRQAGRDLPRGRPRRLRGRAAARDPGGRGPDGSGPGRGGHPQRGQGGPGVTIPPDEVVFFTLGPLRVSATLVFTWVVMALLVVASALVARGMRVEPPLGRGQLA